MRPSPLSADVSQYGGHNDTPPLELKRSVHVADTTRPGQLVKLTSLPLYPSAPIPCPFDNGSYDLVDFH